MRKKNNYTKGRWTDEEKAYVSEGWGRISVYHMAKKLNRTERAIENFGYLNKLGGLYSSGEHYTIVELADIFSVHRSTVESWLKRGLLEYRTIKRKNKYAIIVEFEELDRFAYENPQCWDSSKTDLLVLNLDEDWLTEKIKNDKEKVTTRRAWDIKEHNRFISLMRNGYSFKEIADKMDRTYMSVRKYHSRLIKRGECKRLRQ